MPSSLRLGPVRLDIADLDRSIEYYQRVLGLSVISRSATSATLGAADSTALVELNEVAGARPHSYNRRLGLYHFAILVPSRPDLGRFVRHLAQINSYAGQADHFVSEALYLRDPDGLGIEVYADRPRSEWPVANGKLEMGLDPIDMESLLNSAGPTQWNGMPEGTTIGHVHLHVADLSVGERFFHNALGFDVTATLPAALFLSAGGYHHHLGTNAWAGDAPKPNPGDARLLEWTIVLPTASDVAAAADSLARSGYSIADQGGDRVTEDPWGTALRLTVDTSSR